MPREDRFLTTSFRRNRFLYSRKLGRLLRNATGTRVCVRTVRKRLHAARWKRAVPTLAFRGRDGIIEPVVIPYLQQNNVGIFQNDNARPHTARHTQNILHIHNVKVLQWPARSSDLSPIEHLHVGHQVTERHDVNNIRDLEREMQVIRKLIGSMRRRCLAVLAANGGHTRYWAVSEFLCVTP